MSRCPFWLIFGPFLANLVSPMCNPSTPLPMISHLIFSDTFPKAIQGLVLNIFQLIEFLIFFLIFGTFLAHLVSPMSNRSTPLPMISHLVFFDTFSLAIWVLILNIFSLFKFLRFFSYFCSLRIKNLHRKWQNQKLKNMGLCLYWILRGPCFWKCKNVPHFCYS